MIRNDLFSRRGSAAGRANTWHALIVGALAIPGCIDGVSITDSDREQRVTVLAQVQSAADAPDQSSISGQGALLPVEFILQFGDGCPGKPRPSSNGLTLEVLFDDYTLKTTPRDEVPYAYKSCTVNLRVVGAENVKVAVSHITYVGTGVLITPGSQLQLDSTVRWFGRIQSSDTFKKNWKPTLFGGWDADHSVEGVKATFSDCGTESTPSDRLSINTTLMLFADTPIDSLATMTAVGIEAIAKDAGVPVPTTPPRMIINFRTERCAK